MKNVFVILCFSVLVILTGCATKVTESDLDWPVSEVTEINDNREVEIAEPEQGNVQVTEPEIPDAEVSDKIQEGTVEIIEPEQIDIEPANSSDFLDYSVPFTPQAPFAYWDELHNEACEEASMIMANAWFNNETLNAHLAEQGIIKQVRWQEDNGYTVDLTANETVKILQEYYGLSTKTIDDVSVESIKNELSVKRLVLVPLAGRLVGNPFYKTPGPLYHMMVIRGFDEKTGEFITNDPGTKRGEAYRYKYQTLINSIHDWPKQGKTKDDVSEAEMNAGRKVIISVWK